jgi:hypothetical protein
MRQFYPFNHQVHLFSLIFLNFHLGFLSLIFCSFKPLFFHLKNFNYQNFPNFTKLF